MLEAHWHYDVPQTVLNPLSSGSLQESKCFPRTLPSVRMARFRVSVAVHETREGEWSRPSRIHIKYEYEFSFTRLSLSFCFSRICLFIAPLGTATPSCTP